jgi:hypothetical protein
MDTKHTRERSSSTPHFSLSSSSIEPRLEVKQKKEKEEKIQAQATGIYTAHHVPNFAKDRAALYLSGCNLETIAASAQTPAKNPETQYVVEKSTPQYARDRAQLYMFGYDINKTLHVTENLLKEARAKRDLETIYNIVSDLKNNVPLYKIKTFAF